MIGVKNQQTKKFESTNLFFVCLSKHKNVNRLKKIEVEQLLFGHKKGPGLMTMSSWSKKFPSISINKKCFLIRVTLDNNYLSNG